MYQHFIGPRLFIVILQNADTSLYSDVATFLKGNNKMPWLKNLDTFLHREEKMETSVYRDVSTF